MFALVLLIITSASLQLRIASSSSSSASSTSTCRCLPTDECWPDAQSWDEFNSSVSGRLLRVLAAAAACHDPHFDSEACQVAKTKWSRPFWRADQPGAMQNTNWEIDQQRGCPIQSSRSSACSQGAVPEYGLVMKSTGHDYLGRSTAAGALSIRNCTRRSSSSSAELLLQSAQPVDILKVAAIPRSPDCTALQQTTSFGVVVSATHRTYPALSNIVFASFTFTATLAAAGWSGYFYLQYPWGRLLSVYYLLPNSSVSFAYGTFRALLSYAQQLKVEVSGGIRSFPSLQDWHLSTYSRVHL